MKEYELTLVISGDTNEPDDNAIDNLHDEIVSLIASKGFICGGGIKPLEDG